MESREPKKLIILRILQVLEKYSDADHPLLQEDIVKILSDKYGVEIERKAVGRNIAALRDADFAIENTKNGCYLAERTFEESELRMLIDGVLSSRYITAKHSKELIEKLCTLSNIYFSAHVKNVYSVNEWSKTDNCAVFYNVEIIDEAILNSKKITFNYNKYGVDKKLHMTTAHTVSPYQLILHNQRYYLMALSEKWKNIGYFRLDRITDIELVEEPLTPLRTVEGYENGVDYRDLIAARPYMYSDKPEGVEFYADESICDQIIDWFGYDVRFSKDGERLKVWARVSPRAMEYWAMQYLNSVEIIYPADLREKIKANLANAVKKYN